MGCPPASNRCAFGTRGALGLEADAPGRSTISSCIANHPYACRAARGARNREAQFAAVGDRSFAYEGARARLDGAVPDVAGAFGLDQLPGAQARHADLVDQQE